MEKVSMQVSAGEGAVLKYNDHMLVTDHAWEGFIAAIYEFLESPDEIGGGHAIAWAIEQASNKGRGALSWLRFAGLRASTL